MLQQLWLQEANFTGQQGYAMNRASDEQQVYESRWVVLQCVTAHTAQGVHRTKASAASTHAVKQAVT